MHKENNDVTTKEKGVDIMPSIELFERERVAYVNGMEEYLCRLKKMKKPEAKKISLESLVRSQILQENGEFTERYKLQA